MPFKVYKKQCGNCLFSEDRLVSKERVRNILEECRKDQTHFVCHKSTMNGGGNVCCKAFWDKMGHVSQLARIAQRLGQVEFVDQPDTEDNLTPHRKIKTQ